jgi:hypothetical protein
VAIEHSLSWSGPQNPVGPITWFAQGTLYRLRPNRTGSPPVLYATGANGHARYTHARLTDDEVAQWASLPVPERTARAQRLLAPS